MIKNDWPNSPTAYIIINRFGEQAGDILVRLFCKRPELFPNCGLDFGTDFYSAHNKMIIYES